jgi:hypothetical protein
MSTPREYHSMVSLYSYVVTYIFCHTLKIMPMGFVYEYYYAVGTCNRIGTYVRDFHCKPWNGYL